MDVFGIRNRLVDDYRSYTTSFVAPRDPRIADYLKRRLDDGAQWPDLWLRLNRLPDWRALIQAELDAAMMHVYGLDRDEVDHVLDSVPVLRKYEERDHGEFRTKRLVLDFYDKMAAAAESGDEYQAPIDPPPGQGPRHTPRSGKSDA